MAPLRRTEHRHAGLWIGVLAAASCCASGEDKPFSIEDYFKVQRVSELALSRDGKQAAFVTELHSLEANSAQRATYLLQVSKARPTPRQVAALSEARNISWTTNGELAFASGRSGRDQVHTYDPSSGRIRALTETADQVIKFKFAPNSSAMAFVTQSVLKNETIYRQLRDGKTGIAIDVETASIVDFTDTWTYGGVEGPRRLWLRRGAGTIEEIPLPGAVQDFFWSSDARFLSISYVDTRTPASLFRDYRTSIGVFDTSARKFSALAVYELPLAGIPGKSFAGGEWIPGSHDLVVRRIVEANTWLRDWAFPDIAVVPALGRWQESKYDWKPVEVYITGLEVVPVSQSRIMIATRSRGLDSLLELTKLGLSRSALTDDRSTSNSLFRFSADFRTGVFVKESLSKLPEIYAQLDDGAPFQLTSLNDHVSSKILPHASEVSWSSKDGTSISGWLLSAPDIEKKKPAPLLTYVHGGPAAVFPNAFAPFFIHWPYPFEVLALHGIVVFIPNYRGTLSYGRKVASPNSMDGEPIDDIVSGIDHLVQTGVADASRLGIAGHSHGGWLGPMVATRYRQFRAASFAEGWSNQITLYELFNIQLNREVHEAGAGERSLYEAPARYLELSPDLHLGGLAMASLLETGSEMPILMLGLAKAAQRFGLPSQFIVYPQTGHTITMPTLQRESALRNLNWFLFWLMNEQEVRQ